MIMEEDDIEKDLLDQIIAIRRVLESLVDDKKKKLDKKKNTIKERKIVYKKKDGRLILNPELENEMCEDEIFFHNFMIEKFPRLCEMKEPLSYDEYHKLLRKYPSRGDFLVQDTLEKLNNFSRVNNYISTYRTVDNWIKNDERKSYETLQARRIR